MSLSCRLRLCSPVVVARSLSVPATARGDALPKPFSEIPGPKQLPFIGNGREMMANGHRFREFVHEGFKYGEIYKMNTFGRRYVFIRDPDAIASVLRAEGKYRRRDIGVTDGMNWLIKNRVKSIPSLPQESGEEWKRRRSAIGKQATPRNVHTYASGFNKIYQRFIEYIKNTRGADNVVADIVDPVKLLFVEISAKFVFGNDIDVLRNPSGEYKDFLDAINLQFEVIGRLLVEPPLYKLYNNKLSRDYVKANKTALGVAKKEMEKLFSRLEKGEESEAPGLMEQWLKEGKLSEEEVIVEAVGSFGAGVDTTANQSVFLLHAMASHPEVQERLYQELTSVLGGSRVVTSEHLPQLPYLKGCMLESFRLFSTAPAIPRVLSEECNLLGYTVPAETIVMYSLYSAGRNEKLFPEPMKFDPERWRRDETHAFAIQPFGFGPGSCYGRRFAELEMKLLLAQIALNFKLTTDKPNGIKCVERAILAPDEDVPITFVDRHQNQ